MPYQPLQIANYFIDKSRQTRAELTPLKLLKLVYIAHGWHLSFTNGEPLITERVQAWKYGPVIGSLYDEFKGFGRSQITRKGRDYLTGSSSFVTPELERSDPITGFLDMIWKAYAHLDGTQLSTLTHQPNTAWDRVWNQEGGSKRRNAIIRDSVIREHYDELKKQRLAQ